MDLDPPEEKPVFETKRKDPGPREPGELLFEGEGYVKSMNHQLDQTPLYDVASSTVRVPRAYCSTTLEFVTESLVLMPGDFHRKLRIRIEAL